MSINFIVLTAATPRKSRVRVSVSHINTYQEADTEYKHRLEAGSAIALGHDQEANFLFVTETPQEIDVLIRTAR